MNFLSNIIQEVWICNTSSYVKYFPLSIVLSSFVWSAYTSFQNTGNFNPLWGSMKPMVYHVSIKKMYIISTRNKVLIRYNTLRSIFIFTAKFAKKEIIWNQNSYWKYILKKINLVYYLLWKLFDGLYFRVWINSYFLNVKKR